MASLSDLIAEAKAQLGKPYVYGADGPGSFDCSGLTQYVYGALGISLPRTAAQQQRAATSTSSPTAGDLVFWGNPAHHVALYIGNGMMIAAPHTGDVVKIQQVYGSPTYGRVASFSGTGGLATALSGAGTKVQDAAFGLDGSLNQVQGLSLQVAAAGFGLVLVGVGLWRAVASPVRKNLQQKMGI